MYARLFAQYTPKYIPGNPNIIVQNMAGAGSMIAANHVYNLAAADGLIVGAIFPALYFDQIVGRKEVKYDWSKFVWVGSPVTSNHLLYMRSDTPYKSIADVVSASTQPKCGASGTSSTGYYVPKLLDQVVGTKFDVVLGYQSGQDIDLAVERGELVCRSFTVTAFLRANRSSPGAKITLCAFWCRRDANGMLDYRTPRPFTSLWISTRRRRKAET